MVPQFLAGPRSLIVGIPKASEAVSKLEFALEVSFVLVRAISWIVLLGPPNRRSTKSHEVNNKELSIICFEIFVPRGASISR